MAQNEGQTVDKQLYDRQLYVIGMEAMAKMTNANVLLCGLNGLGIEIAKNVILTGVKSITLYDPKPVTWSDLSSQFFLNEGDIGKNRAKASREPLSELNKYVIIKEYDGELTNEFVTSFDVVVFADSFTAQLAEVNKACRATHTRFIAAESRGLFGSVFVDFGDEFVVTDIDGETPITRIVVDINQDEGETEATVVVNDEERHDLQDGDLVTFSGIEGMDELNDCPPIEIVVTGPYNFKLKNTDVSKFKPYIRNGYVHQVKKRVAMKFLDLESSLTNPSFIETDFAKLDRPPVIHAGFRALSRFQTETGRLPRPYNAEDAQKMVALAKEFDADVSEDIVTKLSYTAAGDINPMATFLGGVVAQEVQKACTGKFTPIKQWMYIDALECLPETLPSEEDVKPQNCRYDGQIAVFGKNFQTTLANSKVFVVGSGALGCEFLKNYAMMGVSTGEGKLIVTDMDNIEVSNLSRQFLFRPQHVGGAKSDVAAKAAKAMNPQINIQSLQEKVAPETEELFHDSFWDSLDVVTNALDNIQARLYVDSRCVYYLKPLLESGTLGTKANVQVVVPHVTESYGSSRDPPEKSFPICTVKNFPAMIEHTIAWAKETFGGLFTASPSDANAFLSRDDFVSSLKSSQRLTTLRTIHEWLVARPQTFEDCIVWARLKFEELFNHTIKQLLYNFPPDSKTSSGTPFWAPPKRIPTPLEFDPTDELHVSFIVSAANLKAYSYGIEGTAKPEAVMAVAEKVIVPEFVPKNVKIKVSDKEEEEDKDEGSLAESDDSEVESLTADLEGVKSNAGKLEVTEFEKDDDTNFHVDFITAASNLRARSYKIPEADRHKTKGIAGKIIPAMITTTALVTGMVGFEFIKLIQGKNKIEDYKNAFVNVALPLVTMSEPMPAPKTTYGDKTFTLWDKFDLDFGSDVNLQEVIDYFQREHKLEVSMVSSGSASIYAFFMAPDKAKDRLSRPLSEVVSEVSKKTFHSKQQYIDFEVLCSNADGDDVDVPPVRYRFRNFSGTPKTMRS